MRNPIRWLLWKLCQKLWDFAYDYEYDTLLYYSCLGIMKFSPAFNWDKEYAKIPSWEKP